MAGSQATNTFDSYDAVGNREELGDKIYLLTPHETPFMSMVGKGSCKTTHPEWQTDTLASPDTDNAFVQGAEYTYDATSVTTRVGNYTQISRESRKIAKTQEKMDKAGRKSEMKREKRKAVQEHKVSMECILLSNQASLAGDASTAPKTGGLAAWIETSSSRGTSGADGGFNTSTNVVDAATNGTQRAFTKAIMDDLIETNRNNGGKAKTLMVSNYVKRVFSTFMSDSNVAAFRTSLSGKKQGTIYGAADLYISDFGDITVVPNTQMTRKGATLARNAYLIDKDMVEVDMYRPTAIVTPSETGDAINKIVITEYALKVHNEAAHGIAADLYGMTAST